MFSLPMAAPAGRAPVALSPDWIQPDLPTTCFEAPHRPVHGSAPYRPRLEGTITTEIAIVGGGLAGLSTALALAEAGRAVVVIEAGRIGGGASGRAGGQILPGFAAPMPLIADQVGAARARALWDVTCAGVGWVGDFARRAGIPCGQGVMIAAAAKTHLPTLEKLGRDLHRHYGHDRLSLYDAAQAAAASGAVGYHGALVDGFARHLDPLALTAALAEAAEAAGVRIYESSPALHLSGQRIVTAHGSIAARQVIAAVNAGARDLLGAAGRTVLPVHSYMVATAPLSPALRRTVLGAGMALYDTRTVLDYMRPGADGRLLFGGGCGPQRDPARIAASLGRRLRRRFPQLADTPITHAWQGPIDLTANQLPQIGRGGDAVIHLHGFSGHGLALAIAAGRAVAGHLCGRGADWQVLADLPARPLPGPRWFAAGLLGVDMLRQRLAGALGAPGLTSL